MHSLRIPPTVDYAFSIFVPAIHAFCGTRKVSMEIFRDQLTWINITNTKMTHFLRLPCVQRSHQSTHLHRWCNCWHWPQKFSLLHPPTVSVISTVLVESYHYQPHPPIHQFGYHFHCLSEEQIEGGAVTSDTVEFCSVPLLTTLDFYIVGPFVVKPRWSIKSGKLAMVLSGLAISKPR